MFKASCSVTLCALLAFSATAQTNPSSAQSGAAPVTLVGCVQKAGDVYTLTDETSKTTAQLRGDKLRKGRHVEVTGTASAASPAVGASEVIDVTSVRRVGGGCPATPGGGGASFMSRGTVVSIGVIAGVAAVAAWATISRLGEARGGK